MKVLVTGGRDFTNRAFFWEKMNELHAWPGPITIVVHGACGASVEEPDRELKGADGLADEWARAKGLRVERFPAEWRHGKRGGMLRNRSMLETSDPDVVVAFPGNNGTNNMVELAQEASLPIYDFRKG